MMATSAGTPTLTEKQKEELNLSILDYLHTNGLTAAFEALRKETALVQFVADGKQKYSGLIEKKWTSVLRLTKKVKDLEDKVATLEASIPSKKPLTSDFIPSETATFTLTAHRGPIAGMVFHPLYSVLATASEDASVKIFDVETGECERTLKGHTKAVNSVAFDFEERGSQLLASASSDLSIKIWDTASDYKCIRTLHGHSEIVSSVAFIYPGDLLVSASRDKTVKIWQLSNGICMQTIYAHDDWVRMVVASEDGRVLASCSNDQSIVISDVATGDVLNKLQGHSHVVECVAFAPVSTSKTILKALNAADSSEPAVAQFLASGSRDNSVKIWNTETGNCVMTLKGHDNWVRSIAFHPNGKYLFTTGDDKTLRIWDLSNAGDIQKPMAPIKTYEKVHDQFVRCLLVHNKRPLIVTGSEDHGVKIFSGSM
ncbi:putative platelet-activating factor acetylhydrolase isoform 1B alpha subunit [Chytriomyces cf. hyalinus JEL632]|nr:putative platelet-activating factor acetylhydrolase isoform 1B alpha subunit [Chytriomyces cf. hyalinus JEL632]